MRLVFAFVGDFPLNIMVELSGGESLTQRSQAPVPFSSFLQAFTVEERSHGGIIVSIYRVNMW